MWFISLSVTWLRWRGIWLPYIVYRSLHPSHHLWCGLRPCDDLCLQHSFASSTLTGGLARSLSQLALQVHKDTHRQADPHLSARYDGLLHTVITITRTADSPRDQLKSLQPSSYQVVLRPHVERLMINTAVSQLEHCNCSWFCGPLGGDRQCRAHFSLPFLS